MGRFAGFKEVYSALYVDFDNIYTRFLEIDPESARPFDSNQALLVDPTSDTGNQEW